MSTADIRQVDGGEDTLQVFGRSRQRFVCILYPQPLENQPQLVKVRPRKDATSLSHHEYDPHTMKELDAALSLEKKGDLLEAGKGKSDRHLADALRHWEQALAVVEELPGCAEVEVRLEGKVSVLRNLREEQREEMCSVLLGSKAYVISQISGSLKSFADDVIQESYKDVHSWVMRWAPFATPEWLADKPWLRGELKLFNARAQTITVLRRTLRGFIQTEREKASKTDYVWNLGVLDVLDVRIRVEESAKALFFLRESLDARIRSLKLRKRSKEQEDLLETARAARYVVYRLEGNLPPRPVGELKKYRTVLDIFLWEWMDISNGQIVSRESDKWGQRKTRTLEKVLKLLAALLSGRDEGQANDR